MLRGQGRRPPNVRADRPSARSSWARSTARRCSMPAWPRWPPASPGSPRSMPVGRPRARSRTRCARHWIRPKPRFGPLLEIAHETPPRAGGLPARLAGRRRSGRRTGCRRAVAARPAPGHAGRRRDAAEHARGRRRARSGAAGQGDRRTQGGTGRGGCFACRGRPHAGAVGRRRQHLAQGAGGGPRTGHRRPLAAARGTRRAAHPMGRRPGPHGCDAARAAARGAGRRHASAAQGRAAGPPRPVPEGARGDPADAARGRPAGAGARSAAAQHLGPGGRLAAAGRRRPAGARHGADRAVARRRRAGARRAAAARGDRALEWPGLGLRRHWRHPLRTPPGHAARDDPGRLAGRRTVQAGRAGGGAGRRGAGRGRCGAHPRQRRSRGRLSMLAAIIRSALRAPGWVVLLAVLVLALGVQRLVDARYDVFPDFVPAQATVQVEAPGFTALQVEQRVTQPIEDAVNGATNVETVRSQSIQGLAVVDVVFKEGSDPFRDRQLLAERVTEAASKLPVGVEAPSLSPMTSSTMDLLKFGLVSDTLDPLTLRGLADWTVKPRLLSVPGVADAIVFGGGVREWQVRVHPDRLAAYGLTLEDVRAAASAATGVRGAGYIDTPGQRVVLEADGGLTDPAQLGRTVLTRHAGRNVTLADVASVGVGAAPAFGDARIDERPGILIAMTSLYGSNTLEVTRPLEKALDDLQPILAAQGVTLVPALLPPATFVVVALSNMRNALAFGAVLVLIVLVLFLKDWRTALISFASIPLSLALAVLSLRWFGWTINTMTLGGLAVALGVVVDDAIIDVENIDRRLRVAGRSAPRIDTILAASLEVRRPVVLATVVVGLVFVPILLLPGLQGSFFAPLAGAFLLATFASLLVALTVTPALCLWLLRPGRRHREPRWLKRMKLAQHRLLERALPHGRALLVAALLVGALTVAALPFFGASLLPEFREGHFVLQVTGPSGASLSEMDRIGERISRGVLAIPGVASVSLQMGRAEAVQDTWPPNRGELHVELKPGLAADAQIRIEAALRKLLDGYPGLGSEVVTFLGDRISE